MQARRLTAEDIHNGYVICGCGQYAYIFKDEVMRRLPAGYNGELCPDCKLQVVPVEKMIELGIIDSKNKKECQKCTTRQNNQIGLAGGGFDIK